MADTLLRLHCESLKLRAYCAVTTDTANEISTIHNTSPNATHALAESITAASLLSAQLKPESKQMLVYKIGGSGPIKAIHVQLDSYGHVRAFVANPQCDKELSIENISFSKAIGAGTLSIIKDLDMKEPYTSVSPIIYGSIAKDTAYYLTSSEQTPSALLIHAKLGSSGDISYAGGILIQTYPDTPEESIMFAEDAIKKLESDELGTVLEHNESLIDFVSKLFKGEKLEQLATTRLSHHCYCSRSLVSKSLSSLGNNDLTAMIEEDKGAEVSCTFCLKKYHFNEDELRAFLKH